MRRPADRENVMEQIRIRRIKQVFEDRKIDNIPEVLSAEFKRIQLDQKIEAGMQIGITVGSRGINNIQLIIKQIIKEIRSKKGVPFIVAAMGSHGGATADGQRSVLEGYGITEESMGVPIQSSMEVIELEDLGNGLKVYFDRIAFEADGIIVVNRVKPHTAFKSDIESGLCKMLSVGLGNHKGANLVHALGVKGLGDYMVSFAKVILKKAPILCGLAILENAYDETYRLMAASPEDFESVDMELLKESKNILPSLPVLDIDILIVKEIGKNISGTGMDTNVIGGIKGTAETNTATPRIKRIIVLDLTKEAHGNALGIGLADLTTKRLYDKIDFAATYANTITTTFLDRAKLPIVVKSDKEAMDIALKTVWNLPGTKPRVVIILNTLKLDEIFVSETIWREIESKPNISPMAGWEEIRFSDDGNLTLEI